MSSLSQLPPKSLVEKEIWHDSFSGCGVTWFQCVLTAGGKVKSTALLRVLDKLQPQMLKWNSRGKEDLV